MEYKFIKTFLLVADHLSFAKAAGTLKLTPAAVTRQIQLLEQSLQTQLLIRSPKHVSLTTSGRELYEQANRFDRWIASRYQGNARHTVRLGAIEPMLIDFVPEVVLKFFAKDKYRIEITHGSPSQITNMLMAGELDLGLYNKNIQGDSLTSRRLFPEIPTLISKRKISEKDLAKEAWIITEPKDYIINFSKKKGLAESEDIIMVNSPRTQIKMVEQGAGVAIVSSLMIRNCKKLYTQQISMFNEEYMYATTASSKYISHPIKELLGVITRHALLYRSDKKNR